jgi:hypothetical protein
VPLSEADFKATEEHLKNVWKDNPCPMCGTKTWVLAGYIGLTITPDDGAIPWGAGGIPCVAAICQNCGNTQLVALRVIRGNPQTTDG